MSMLRSTPTLYDVAAKSGVSTATVSRCLNFPDQVAEKTRKKVMSVVADLGYSPNFGARAMASKRTNTIGAIIPTMENAIFARGLEAFQQELLASGFTLLVASTGYESNVEEEQIRALVARGADALFLIGHERAPAIYKFLEAQDIPFVVTWAFDPRETCPSIGFNNRKCMAALARRVMELGHRRLALISADVTMNDRARERLHGIHDAMADFGLKPGDLPIVDTSYSIENGATAFRQLMQRDPPPTAVFCGNDVLAVGALRAAREMGVDVPGAVSITGFDDIELAQVAYPALTTVHVPHREMGRMAARILIRLLQKGTFDQSIELKADIRMRDSLAAPASPTS